ncbi:hypothetical protein CHL67_02000 [Prosthecochloris sp. GSB1]|uniref:PhoP regulatory network protein YrbL n=1 Tax=Prosthecochloris sp. GSB1 TaxID=281093 RepID=UPI000B8CE8DB|nr:PhoP regulatory network protein YrbL [Prosthecochloris sp. GSB1]ASQ89855.1 hypothetical protein CHL67_02000 [Prosthecochloris sp. GSB1]
MVDLNGACLIGKGSSRLCYVHPADERKCIKVVYTRKDSIIPEELKYYRFHEKRRISWEMMARNYGTVETSEGEGIVFSLPRDHDGEISRTLAHYLESGERTPPVDDLCRALRDFLDYLRRERIIVREIKAENLVLQRTDSESVRIILVDGVGNNEFLPIANYSNLFARRTLSRKWRKFLESLRTEYGSNTVASEVSRRLRS